MHRPVARAGHDGSARDGSADRRPARGIVDRVRGPVDWVRRPVDPMTMPVMGMHGRAAHRRGARHTRDQQSGAEQQAKPDIGEVPFRNPEFFLSTAVPIQQSALSPPEDVSLWALRDLATGMRDVPTLGG